MKLAPLALCCSAAAAMTLTPLGCDESGTTNRATESLDGGLIPDGGAGHDSASIDVDPPLKSDCVAPTRGPTFHDVGSVTAAENDVWTADASPHILRSDTTIYKTVTVEPCGEVLVGEGKKLRVLGKLIAEGRPTKRIHIGARSKGKPFLYIGTEGAGAIRLTHATLDGGGAVLNHVNYFEGILYLSAAEQKPNYESLFVDHVTVEGSLSNGVVLSENAAFAPGSTSLVVKDSAAYPLSVWANSVSGIPSGSYTGNANDEILLSSFAVAERLTEDATIHDRGVPYRVGYGAFGQLIVNAAVGQPLVTLTIEPGVTMRFNGGGRFVVGDMASGTAPTRASLVAVGTAAKPIVLTSAAQAPAAGDWVGVHFVGIPAATSKLDFVRVEYAGFENPASGYDSCFDNAELRNDAAIRLGGPPTTQFITNTTIVASKTNGIDRRYRSTAALDFLPTNTFTDVALCNQTFPPDDEGACPAPVPCPTSP